uniref:Rho GTPase activating protein 27 n=1 Tax=Hippocampus comes TaxID=109280 RepID=A0A3Q2XVF1_HIPCM
MARDVHLDQMTVQHEFEHETHDGRLVSITPDETYLLLTRTNEHRWYVRTKQEDTEPIYIPAQYVRNAQGDSCQFSTFGVCDAKPEVTPERLTVTLYPPWFRRQRTRAYTPPPTLPAALARSSPFCRSRMHFARLPQRSCRSRYLGSLPSSPMGHWVLSHLLAPIYANVAQLRQDSADSLLHQDADGWEVHFDPESGQDYYYPPATGHTTWENPLYESSRDPEPLPPSPPRSPTDFLSTASRPAWTSDWEQLVDERSGCPYFYNAMSGETSWEPPEPLSPYPPLMEPMSVHHYPAGADGPDPDEDPLPMRPSASHREYNLSHVSRAIIPRASLDRSTPAGWSLNVEPDGTWVFSNEYSLEQWVKSVDDLGQTYYYLKDGSKSQWNLPKVSIMLTRFCTVLALKKKSPVGFQVHNLEKAGILNKTKVSENGKKVRKNWAQTWTVLHGGMLTFHKDPKSTSPGISVIVPEVTVDLRGAMISWASKDKSSKKNVLELKSKSGVEFLIQYDTESIITDWHKVLLDTIRQLVSTSDAFDATTPSILTSLSGMKSASRPSVNSTSGGETDPKKVRTKLIKFLMKRPSLQAVKEKGYIRENVFGCHLAMLCAQERTTVPRFVEKCIKAVERRGLDIDGLYRVSGNLATIQKLRFKADHEELDLEDGQWADAHVLTGALKLFFRELPEPLFPYNLFHKFISAIRIPDYNTKVCCIYELIKSLPIPNHDTMSLLFGHLRRVIQCGEDNRMTVHNVAIVFGPTLLRPEAESGNIAMHTVFQNQIVELILHEYERLFQSG